MHKLFLFIFLLLFSHNLYAYKGDFYAGFNTGGVFFTEDSTGTFTSDSKHVNNDEFSIKFENELFTLEAIVGYSFFKNIVAEAEVNFIKNNTNSSFISYTMPEQSAFDHSTNFTYGFLNALYRVDMGDVLPYAGVGAGIASLSFFTYSAIGMTYKAIAGIDVALTDTFYLNTNYRYTKIKKEDFKVSTVGYKNTTTDEVMLEEVEGNFVVENIPSHSVSMGIKFIF